MQKWPRARFAQIAFRNVGKFVYTGMNQKAFEANHARIPEFGKLVCITGHDAAPESDIDIKLAARSV